MFNISLLYKPGMSYLEKSQDRTLPKWKRFEYLAAHNLDMLVWEDVTPTQLKKYNIPHNADYGIDLISPDFTKTAQVKYYGSDTNITWRSVSTYIAYSTQILGITDMTLVTTPDVKISKMVSRIITNIVRYQLDIDSKQNKINEMDLIMRELKDEIDPDKKINLLEIWVRINNSITNLPYS
jgi:hypothetical protein